MSTTSSTPALELALRDSGEEFESWQRATSDPARLEQVRELGLLDTASAPEFDRLTRIARRSLGGSVALLSVIDDRRQYNKSIDGAGEEMREFPIEGSFCRHVVAKQSAVFVPDASEHGPLRALLGDNPLGIQSYAGVPLTVDGDSETGVHGEGKHVVGVLCVLGDRPQQFSAADLEALEDIAQLAADELALHRANERIEAQRRLLMAVVDGIDEAVLVLDKNMRVVLRNRAYGELFGAASMQSDVIDRSVASRGYFEEDGVSPLDFDELPIARVLAGETRVRALVAYRAAGQPAPRYLVANATALRKPDGNIGAAISVMHDVTEERTRQRAHEEREVLLDVVLANLPGMGVFVFDHDLRFLVASGDEVLKNIGISTAATGQRVADTVSPRRLPLLEAAFRTTLAGQKVSDHFEHRGLALDARTIPLQSKDGTIFAGIGLLNDVTERKEADRLLQQQARELEALSLSDELTGLHNRRGFMTLAGQQLKLAVRSQRHAAVVYLDVNDLKPVNDNLGHEEGDRLLRDVAKVLRASFRESDVIARLGGDEFAVLTVDVGPTGIEVIERRLSEATEEFNTRAERPYRMSISLGTELFDPASEDTLEALLSRADERMYARKVALKKSRL